MEEVVIPSINQYGKKFRSDWKDVTLTEFLKWIGIWIAQKLLIASMVKPGNTGSLQHRQEYSSDGLWTIYA